MTNDFLNYLFDKAHDSGLEDCEIYSVYDREIAVHSQNGQTVSSARSAAFEGRINGRTVSAYTESFELSDADFLVKSCTENASFMQENEKPSRYAKNEPVDFESYDENALNIDAVCEKVKSFTAELNAYGEMFSGSSVKLKSQVKEIKIVNDRGLSKGATTSRIHALADIVRAERGRSDNCNFYVDGSSLSQIDFVQPLKAATENLNAYHNGQKPKTGRYKAVFTGEAYSYLLMVTALFFAKDYVDGGNTRFANKIGSEIAGKCLVIYDDPRLDGGFFSVPFDAQGVPTKRRALVENGILKGFCCDISTAQECDEMRAGCFTRSRINLPPAISVTNMYVQRGKRSRAELLEMLGEGLMITEVSDYFHRHGTDPVSGDFSMPARGYFVGGGKLQGAAIDFAIEGNLYDLLASVSECGDKMGYAMPSCLYPGMPMRIGGHSSPDVLVSAINIQGGQ